MPNSDKFQRANMSSFLDDRTPISMPRPLGCSTVNQKSKTNLRGVKNVEDDDSLSIISVKSDLDDVIENIELKKPTTSKSYIQTQRELAGKLLDKRRESGVGGIPSKYLRPSEISTCSTSFLEDSSKGSTVNESDLLLENGKNTSTPRCSIVNPNREVDIAESLMRMSLELGNPQLSLTAALAKMDEEYKRIQNDLSCSFQPVENLESQLMKDELEWKNEFDLPVNNRDFTLNQGNDSKLSISAYFRQRSEDISNVNLNRIAPTSSILDAPNASNNSDSLDFSLASSVSKETSENSKISNDSNNLSLINEGLSVEMIAKILKESDETPTKLLDKLLKQIPSSSKETGFVPKTKGNVDISRQLSLHNGENSHDTHAAHISNISLESVNSPQFASLGKDNYQISKSTIPFESPEILSNQFVVSNKENLENLQNFKGSTKSLNSLRSTSSLSNLPNGKLPIDSTNSELIWGCTKAGKSSTKSFSIRNKSSNKLRIQCTILGPLFRFEDTNTNILKLTLHANETKCISVSFNPLKDGAVVDEIIFTPTSDNLQQTRKQSIKLFGYGGYGHVDFKNVSKDGAGKCWLTLSLSNNQTTFETIDLINKGTLTAFANLGYNSKGILFSKIEIEPNFLVIPPGEKRSVVVSFKMSKEDFKCFIERLNSNSVIEIGTLRIVSGSEATRGRIRRLSRLALERNLALDNFTLGLQKEFEGEQIPNDVTKCRENVSGLQCLLKELSQKEIGIVVEKDQDATLVQFEDETSLFQTLCFQTSSEDTSTSRNDFYSD